MGWGAEDEGLGEPDEDLAEHCDGEVWRRGARASIADPVAGEDEKGGRYQGEARATGVEGIDCEGSGDDEGEEKSGAEPIDDGGGGGEIFGCGVGYRGKRKPLDQSSVTFPTSTLRGQQCGTQDSHPS